MKVALIILSLLVAIGCDPADLKQRPEGEVASPPLNHSVPPDDGKRHTFRAIVDWPIAKRISKQQELRLHPPVSPKGGGIQWALPGTDPVLAELDRCNHQNGSLWIEASFYLDDFAASFQINPDIDPWAVARDVVVIRKWCGEKVKLELASYPQK